MGKKINISFEADNMMDLVGEIITYLQELGVNVRREPQPEEKAEGGPQ